jgi:hypothetical protein
MGVIAIVPITICLIRTTDRKAYVAWRGDVLVVEIVDSRIVGDRRRRGAVFVSIVLVRSHRPAQQSR